MAITPAPGYIVDPNNPNGVIRDPGVAPNPGGWQTFAAPPTSTASAAPAPAPVITTPTTVSSASPAPAAVSSTTVNPDDQKLLAMGITPEQLKQLNTPEGLDPSSFQALIGNVETRLKMNNDLVTTRGYLMKQLYDSPLTSEELAKLPEDIQRVVKTGDKNTIELQMRLLNDQIAGRANTLSQSISFLTDGYQKAIEQRQSAVDNIFKFAQNFVNPTTGKIDLSKARSTLEALYPGVNVGGIIDQLQGMMPVSEYNKQFYQGSLVGGAGVRGDVSQPQTLDATQLASPPTDEEFNTVVPSTVDPKSGTGRTYGSMYQDAWDMLYTGKNVQSYLGGLSGASGPGTAIKNTIQNIAAAIQKTTGTMSYQFAALYKANASAATQNIQRLARVESITSSVVNQMPRLATLADKVAAEGVVLTESDLQATQADIQRKFGNTDAAAYLELVQTIRADYSANNAALAGSRGGEFFSRTADVAIPVGLTGAQYNTIKDTMVQSTKNIRDGINGEVQKLLGTSGQIMSPYSPDTGTNSSDSIFDDLYKQYGGK